MKYMGSKSKIIRQILPYICNGIGNRPYVEPFAGGFNSICEVNAIGGRYANDINKYVVLMFDALLDGWVPKKFYSKEEYTNFKKLEGEPHEIGYVGINCSFRGKWFGGYAGIIKIKNNKGEIVERNYQTEAFNNVMKQIPKLEGVTTSFGSYDDMFIPSNSLIYCDPPYSDTTEYFERGFDYNKFWDWVRTKSIDNEVYVSEYNAPDDFEVIWSKEMNVALGSKVSKKATEKLFRIRT